MGDLLDPELDELWTWTSQIRADRDASEAAHSGILGFFWLFGLEFGRPRSHVTFSTPEIRRLLSTRNKRAIAPLLELLALSLGRHRLSVISALTRLLRSVDTGDDLDMLGRSRWRLMNLLEEWSPNTDSSLLLAGLHAVEHAGSELDIERIHSLTYGRAQTLAEKSFRESARRCLSTLEVRRLRNLDSRYLLRSAPELSDSDSLLRANRTIHNQEPEKLLRTADPALHGESVPGP